MRTIIFGLMLFMSVALVGCAQSGRQVHISSVAPELSGYVSLATLVRANPDYAQVSQLDKLIALNSAQTIAFPQATDSSASDVPELNMGALPVADTAVDINALDGSLSKRQTEHLDLLRERVESAGEQRLKQSSELIARQTVAEYQSKRLQVLLDNGNAASGFVANPQRQLELRMQISALQQDVQSAAVAPPGYWKKMLDERDQELIGLEAQEAQTEIKMNQQISADLNRMSADLDAQRDKKIADVRQDQENRQNALLKSESDLLTAQRTDIVSGARDFDEHVTTIAAQIDASNPPLAARQSAGSSKLTELAAPAKNARDYQLVRLRALRAREELLVANETRRAAMDVAKKRHWIILGWSAESGACDLTGPLLKALS